MDEFAQTKLGEAIGYARTGIEFATRGGEHIEVALGGEKHAGNFTEVLTAYRDTLEQDATELTATQAQSTSDQLRDRMDSLLDERWEEQIALLEWLSEYCAGALAKWSTLLGYAEAADINTLAAIAHQANDFYTTQIEFTKEQLVRVGTDEFDSKR